MVVMGVRSASKMLNDTKRGSECGSQGFWQAPTMSCASRSEEPAELLGFIFQQHQGRFMMGPL